MTFPVARVTLIDRFIAREVLLFTAMATATLSIVLVLGNVFREVCELLVHHRVPMSAILEFVACAAPFCLTYTLPWGFLTALFLVFGRMAADRELLVMHGSGVTILRVCLPVLVIAFVLSTGCLWINAEVNPRARQHMKVILHDLAISALLKDTATHRLMQLPNRVLYIGTQDEGKLSNIQIYEYDEESQLERTVLARKGWLETVEESDELVIHMDGVISDERSPDAEEDDDDESVRYFHDGISAQEASYNISLFQAVRKYTSTNFKSLGSQTLGELREQLKTGQRHSTFLSEFNKRIALSLSCVAFVLVGVPIAILLHRKETTIGFGLGLAMACSYFAFFMVADNCRDNPAAHPELLMWLGNAVFIPLGGFLFWRLSKR
jgi:lipopolysaccharide export system permease protein